MDTSLYSQNLLNKGIFQMWIHHYIDMNPHKSKHIKVVYLLNVDTSLYRHVSTLTWHQIQKGGYIVYLLNVDTSLRVRSAHLSPGLPTGLTRVNPGWVLSLILEKVGNTG